MCSQNWFFGFHSASMLFFEKKFQSRIRYPISLRKGYIHIYCAFYGYFGKSFFFLKKLLHEKYSKPQFLQKSLETFLSPDTPFPSKWSYPFTNGFSQFFQHKLKNFGAVFLLESILKNIGEVFLLKSILNRKKILWRINFVLIKFSSNALLFEKLQN